MITYSTNQGPSSYILHNTLLRVPQSVVSGHTALPPHLAVTHSIALRSVIRRTDSSKYCCSFHKVLLQFPQNSSLRIPPRIVIILTESTIRPCHESCIVTVSTKYSLLHLECRFSIHMGPHSYGITFIWDHIHMGSHSYGITFIWDHIHIDVQPIAFGVSFLQSRISLDNLVL